MWQRTKLNMIALKYASANTSPTQSQVASPGLVSYGIESNAKFDAAPTGYEKRRGSGDDSKPKLTPYPATLTGLQQARRNCKMEMNKIVKEVCSASVTRDSTDIGRWMLLQIIRNSSHMGRDHDPILTLLLSNG